MARPKLVKQVFEGRYDRGYRYLDRCGEAMLILEEVLSNETGRAWMPDDMVPAGARIKCPEMDMTVAFDTYHLVVDQDPADDTPALAQVAKLVLAVISARFDLQSFARLGHRRFCLIATDSIEQAQQLSLKMVPLKGWPIAEAGKLRLAAAEAVSVYENEDASEGFRYSVKSTSRADAPQQIDQRLLQSPRLLPSGQREALLKQLHRQSQREKDPLAGVMVDIDYYWTRPSKPDIEAFLDRAGQEIDRLLKALPSKEVHDGAN